MIRSWILSVGGREGGREGEREGGYDPLSLTRAN